jgi:hypothetical protein
MATAVVRKAHLKTGKKVLVGDGSSVLWSEVFDHNPRMTRKTSDGVWVKNYAGNRPYIDYAKSTREKFVWLPFKAEPGEIYFSPHELRWTESDFVYIEPNVKGSFSGNKDWGFDNWQAVVDRLPQIRWIQGRGRRLKNVLQLDTRSFRDALALLSRAFLFVGTDGGMHHGAAALGIPAVVVWGGLVGPQTLGYETHTNLCKASWFCGSHLPCLHCRQALDSITPDMVAEAIEKRTRLLSPGSRGTPTALCEGSGLDVPGAQAT